MKAVRGIQQRARAAPSRPPPWWRQQLSQRENAFQKIPGGVESNSLFGLDGLNRIGRARARSPGSGSPDQRGILGEAVRRHNQQDYGGEGGSPTNGVVNGYGTDRVGGERASDPPITRDYGPGTPGWSKGPRQARGETDGDEGDRGGNPPKTRGIGPGTPGGGTGPRDRRVDGHMATGGVQGEGHN